MLKRSVTLLSFVFTIASSAQSHPKAPYKAGYSDVHRVTRPEYIRGEDEALPEGLTPIQRAVLSQDRIYGNMIGVNLDVTINENGRVESAHAEGGPKKFYERAEALEMHQAFQPIVKDGTVVRAHFQDTVRILPPEHWHPQPVSFPDSVAMHNVTIRLERTGCYGPCASYVVTIHGDGKVVFDGGSFSAIPGKHKATISLDDVSKLYSQFRAAKFLSALDDYTCSWTDLPSQTLTLSINGLDKKVVDYGGEVVGLPQAIKELEEAVDRTAQTARWVRGDEQTLPSLQAEHWNFSSPTKENITLYVTTIGRGNRELISHFIAEHAPVYTTNLSLTSPVCMASEMSNVDLVKQMLTAIPPETKLPQQVLNQCLDLSAKAGSAALTSLWLDRGASVVTIARPKDDETSQYFPSPLLSAIRSGNPEVVSMILDKHPGVTSAENNGHSIVSFAMQYSDAKNEDNNLEVLRLLIEAGANVNEATEFDRPAIFSIGALPAALPMLIRAGADTNQRDEDGQTPLMRNYYASDTIRILLAAGADPTLKSSKGKTALDEAKSASCAECVKLLQAAILARGTTSPSAR